MLYTFHHSKANKNLPLQLRLLGLNHLQEPVKRPNGMSCYQWFFCTKGKGEFIINHQKSIISEGQGLLIYPDLSHSYQGLSPDWTLHLIGFTGKACQEILQSLKMLESGVYHISDPNIFPSHIQNLLHLSQRELPSKERELSKGCYNLLLDLAPCISRINTTALTQENELILELISYMEENYARDLSLTELAGHINLSKEYMCTLFKQNMQQTVMHYLLGIRITRARILLLQYPEKKVGDIARMCGFESPSYFGKVFKKNVGCTPDAFRRT